jgi:N-acetylglucosamine kinase-like BadF-type ATPase
MLNSRFILGVDAGGSKCHGALWETANAGQLDQAGWNTKTDGINLDVIPAELATERLKTLISQAAHQVQLSTADLLAQTYMVIGMAGLDTNRDMAAAQQWLTISLAPLGQPARYVLLTDVELALWSAHPQGEGILLIAGTGSNCFGRASDARTAKTGGLSHFFSDEGGGFDLGWQALHLLGKMYDGRLAKTALWDAIFQQYQVPGFAELKQLVTHAADYKQIVAKAAPVVQALATQGDHDCKQLVERGVAELTAMADGVARQLQTHLLPVYLVGGLFADEYYRQQLLTRLETVSLHGEAKPISAPVTGATAYWQAHAGMSPGHL